MFSHSKLTSLRNSIGQHDLDEVLQERDKINNLLCENIAPSTEARGVFVERFERKDVELPIAMQEVMAVQAQAIREKRARIIKAGGGTGSLGKACSRGRADGQQPGRGRVEADADGDGGWRGE